MFSRLMAVTLAVILVCVFGLTTLFYMTTRSNYIDARLNELKMQADEIAYLASRVRSGAVTGFSFGNSTESYISWKADNIYKEFNAYSVVVDRMGQITVYMTADLMNESGLEFDRQHVMDTLAEVLKGKQIIRQQEGPNGPMFTVAVPWMDNGVALGAVYIQTAAQTVYAGFRDIAINVSLAALVVLVTAAVAIFFITRQMVKPLRVMAQAAGEFAVGKFETRVPVTGSSETRELAGAFNLMAGQLAVLEQTRRDFVANVSHELRSPMTSMQGFLEGMLDGTIPASEHDKYMQIVLDETRRLSRLVATLLNLSRMENSEIQLAYSDFDIHECIRRVIISNMNQLDEKDMEVSLNFEDDPLYVHADAEQIEQVLINLVSNAIKYTPAGGHITIDTVQDKSCVRVTVRDNGPGVSPEDAPYIFDRFYKADKSHTVGMGTGLGLAISKRIMEKHEQTLRLLPDTEGAAFEFTLENGHAEEKA